MAVAAEWAVTLTLFHLYQYVYSVITPFRLAVQPHPLCTLCPHLLNVLYSLILLLHSLTRLLYSITSSLCCLTRRLSKLSDHSPAFLAHCPLSSFVWSSIQPWLLAVQPLLFIVQFYQILVPVLTPQLTMYFMYSVHCTSSPAHCPALLVRCPAWPARFRSTSARLFSPIPPTSSLCILPAHCVQPFLFRLSRMWKESPLQVNTYLCTVTFYDSPIVCMLTVIKWFTLWNHIHTFWSP
jgi:hypothetical protein